MYNLKVQQSLKLLPCGCRYIYVIVSLHFCSFTYNVCDGAAHKQHEPHNGIIVIYAKCQPTKRTKKYFFRDVVYVHYSCNEQNKLCQSFTAV